MAKNHFSFKKRQKELARQKKKEEKRQRKLEKKTAKTDDIENPLNRETAEDETRKDERENDDRSSSASGGLRPGEQGETDRKDNEV